MQDLFNFVIKTNFCVTMTLIVTQKTVTTVLCVTLLSTERPESFNPDMFAAFNCAKINISYNECHKLIQFIINSKIATRGRFSYCSLKSMVARFSTSRSDHTLPKMVSEI